MIVGATTLQTIFNAARARSYGIEVETNWQPTPEFNLGANFSVLNARYTNFKDVPLPFGTSILVSDPAAAATVMNGVTISPAGQRRVFAPGYNCTPTPNTGGPGQPALAFGCDLSGKTVPRSPPWSGSAFASYRFDLGSSGALTPFAAVTFSGGHFEQVFNDPLSKQNAYAKLDLTLTWDYSSKLAVELFGTNVTNEQIQNLTSYGGIPIQANYEPPRMFGLRFTVRN